MSEITLDRNGEEMSHDAVKVMIQLYKDLGKDINQRPVRKDGVFMWEGDQKEDYYVNKFEIPFLKLSEAHFLSRAIHWITTYSCEDYLTNVKNALELEQRNADQWLLARSKPLIIDLSVKFYVTDMAQEVINKEDGVEKFF